MSNITDFLKYELYPTLFQSIDTALPEFNFKGYSGGWRSSLKIDLSNPKERREDKTVVTKKAPGYILEQGGEVLSLVDYIIKKDNIDFIQAVKKLADVVGLELPKGDFNQESYQSYKDQATILEDCNSYFIYCLETSTGADKVKAYLSSRGYNLEDVKAMEIGYIPNQESLNKYLLKKGYSQSLIDEVVKIKTDTRIGSTHSLTIPYRSGGSIKGFKFRTIEEDTPKYLNSSGLDKIGGFFNLLGIKGDKDIVIVEGELDSLHATIKGVNNIVATGGSSINKDQVKDAIKRGAKSFTICLDTEPGKEEATAKNINSAIEVILGEGVNRVYIVTLPDLGGGKTDPDRLIIESGVDSFKTAIAQALPYFIYKLSEILDKYIEKNNGLLSYKDKDNLLDEIVILGSTLNPLDKEQYLKAFTSLESIKELGITEKILAITVDKLTTTKDKEAQAIQFKKLLTEATKLQDKGEIDKALELLDKRVKEVKLKDKATEFSSLLVPTSEAHVKKAEENKPKDLETGYTISGEDFLLPGGAITVYAGATGHGKTILSINTALNVAERYPDKKFIFLTYEERDTAILQYFLNTYIDIELNNAISPKSNRRVIKDYFKTGSTQYISEKNITYFESKKAEFFKTYIETGRLLIKYVDYNSEELDLAIRYLHKTDPNIGGVFIDYFQLLNLPGEVKRAERINSRQEELKEICQSLKRVAVDTGLPLILGAQFNRDVTDLTKVHPTKISEAGDIERIVNTLVGLWDISKNIVGKDTSKGEESEIKKRTKDATTGMYVELLKSRELQTGIYEVLDYNGKTGKIKNRDKDSYSNHFK